ncbi:ComGF family competence protein [Virgibacillus necropolis]|uniref:competence type IV pilus minor pilin ComGF n=1 Tax=Virgibacillus necropolis TaxID=163877 RepID=UPI00384CB76A
MRKKRHVCSDILVKQKGFTLLSTLLTIAILFITVPFLEYITKSLSYTTNYTDLSANQLFHFMRDDLIRSTDYTIGNQVVSLKAIDGTTVTYEKYEDIIRRQVDSTGHEVVIRNVKSLSFEEISYGIKTIIITMDGAVYEKKFTIYN